MFRLSILVRILTPLFVLTILEVASDPRILSHALHRAHVAIRSGDNQGAFIALSQAAPYMPWRSELWEQAGIQAVKAGMIETAKSNLQSVEKKGELSAEGLQAMGDIFELEGDFQSAVRYWEQAQKAGLKNFDLSKKLAAKYRQLGEIEAAIQQLNLALDSNPGDADANYDFGLMLAALDPESAPAYLILAEELDPDYADHSQTIIRAIRSARRTDDPAYLFTSAGQALASIEEWDLAAIALSNAVEINPDFADAWAYLGEAHQHTDQSGFSDLNKALEIEPDNIAGNTLMALYWQRQERYELALIHLHTAANQDAQNPVIQAEIGNTLAMLGNISAAESHYLRAVDLAPRDPQYWRTLANFYITHDLDLRERGLSSARKAVILAPDDPAALDVLAHVYIQLDHPLIARRFLDRAIEADPDFAPAQLHLGMLYLMDGKTYQAYEHLNKARSLSVENSQIAHQARRLIESIFP